MFKDVEYIDIKVVGSRNGGACRPARPDDIARFPEHYEAFKKRTEAPVTGTALAEWALVSRSLVEELAYHNVKTVEQLRDMPDVHASKMLGMMALKAKAVKWLESASDTARLNQLEALETANSEKDERIAKLESVVADMMVKLEATEEVAEETVEEVQPTPKKRATRSRKRRSTIKK